MSERVRTVVFRDGEFYIASCLEIDVCQQGMTPQEAEDRMRLALQLEGDLATASGGTVWDIGPAPGYVHSIYRDDAKAMRRGQVLVEAKP